MKDNYMYIVMDASYYSEEEFESHKVLIDKEDDEFIYAHYEENNLRFKIDKSKVYRYQGNCYVHKEDTCSSLILGWQDWIPHR